MMTCAASAASARQSPCCTTASAKSTRRPRSPRMTTARGDIGGNPRQTPALRQCSLGTSRQHLTLQQGKNLENHHRRPRLETRRAAGGGKLGTGDWDGESEGDGGESTSGNGDKGGGEGGEGGDAAGGAGGKTKNKNKPPERDTGIAREKDMGIELEGDAKSGTDRDGHRVFRKSGVDRGDGGYRCRWTVQGRSAQDATWEYRETHWEKGDASGYKELGAEKSGFNEVGDTWWETWKEMARTDESSGVAHIERSADKWARDPAGREWHEKWWERYNAAGYVERGVEKNGRHGSQAWWEKWGEQQESFGGDSIKWTDKWAENGSGTRWGDKWEERFRDDGGGKKEGETWRVSPGGERWSRTWGEVIEGGAGGGVRKYGQSTSGEQWDYESGTPEGGGYYDRMRGYSWGEVVENSTRLLSIETPVRGEE